MLMMTMIKTIVMVIVCDDSWLMVMLLIKMTTKSLLGNEIFFVNLFTVH